jgi:hypothetical protein
MDIKITQTLTNRFYNVKFDIILTDDENKLINKYGDPDVNYGGIITHLVLDVETPYFTLPDNYRKLRSGSGWIQKFDGNMDVLAEDKAKEYASNVRTRLGDVIAELRANVDTFSIVDTKTV